MLSLYPFRSGSLCTVPLKNGIQRLQTGDLVLFAGKGLVSLVVQLCTRSRWSHIGMVVREEETGRLMILESTNMSKVADVHSGDRVAGVQLVDLYHRISTYEGQVAVRRLRNVCWQGALNNQVQELISQLRYRPYKHYVPEMLLEVLTGFRKRKNLSRVFCSELVAEIYQTVGVLSRSRKSNRFVPGHFDNDEKLPLLQGQLDEPVVLQCQADRHSLVI